MPAQSRLTYIQHMVLMMVIAVVGWAVFLGLFLLIFTDSYEPSVSRTVWWVGCGRHLPARRHGCQQTHRRQVLTRRSGVRRRSALICPAGGAGRLAWAA